MDKNQAVRNAIDVMTAWATEQDSSDFAADRVREYLAGPDEGVEFVVGLVSLCGWVLVRLAGVEGESGNATPDEIRAILQDIARKTLS